MSLSNFQLNGNQPDEHSVKLPLDVFHHIVPNLDLLTKRKLRTTCSQMRSFMSKYMQEITEITNISDLVHNYHFPSCPQWIEVIPSESSDSPRSQSYKKVEQRTPHFFMHVQEVTLVDEEPISEGFSVFGRTYSDDGEWRLESNHIAADAIQVIKVFESRPPSIEEPPSFYRLGWDRAVEYGDGGSDDLSYPVYVQEHLDIPKKTQRNLARCLEELAKTRSDFQPNNVVEDIIDPDLFPLRFQRTYKERMQQRSNELKLEKKSDDGIDRGLRRGQYDEPSSYVRLREQYHWIPCEISISRKDHFIRFESPIHNLPLNENKELYICIAKVFRAMVPMMQRLNLIDDSKPETRLQVVVKAQSYHIQPGTSYAGRWHTEGVNENIIAAGVYYCHVDPDLTGGNLKFRPSSAPQDWYDIETDYEAPVCEGGAIFFANTIPHRFRKIFNQGSEKQVRSFLNFFIVDPKRPLTSTRNLPSDYQMEPIGIAKRLRNEARSEMKKSVKGWGWINWGNCGTIEHIYDSSVWRYWDRSEVNITETDSGANDRSD
eukprot:TRINITY_DN22214_c0_g1_i1.p1 TRINITY_DN22214_c0_g1~~TRINITY_DN22214_c0_g1_i1.p1  ORF type:complete len:544 (+),score=128.21 TRINITY_DN22214_c0_g1_i1:46-1677(+)